MWKVMTRKSLPISCGVREELMIIYFIRPRFLIFYSLCTSVSIVYLSQLHLIWCYFIFSPPSLFFSLVIRFSFFLWLHNRNGFLVFNFSLCARLTMTRTAFTPNLQLFPTQWAPLWEDECDCCTTPPHRLMQNDIPGSRTTYLAA